MKSFGLHLLRTQPSHINCLNVLPAPHPATPKPFVSDNMAFPGTNKILNTKKYAGRESTWQLSVTLIIQRNQNMLIVIISMKMKTKLNSCRELKAP